VFAANIPFCLLIISAQPHSVISFPSEKLPAMMLDPLRGFLTSGLRRCWVFRQLEKADCRPVLSDTVPFVLIGIGIPPLAGAFIIGGALSLVASDVLALLRAFLLLG
jgi:hypothetical protein